MLLYEYQTQLLLDTHDIMQFIDCGKLRSATITTDLDYKAVTLKEGYKAKFTDQQIGIGRQKQWVKD